MRVEGVLSVVDNYNINNSLFICCEKLQSSPRLTYILAQSLGFEKAPGSRKLSLNITKTLSVLLARWLEHLARHWNMPTQHLVS